MHFGIALYQDAPLAAGSTQQASTAEGGEVSPHKAIRLKAAPRYKSLKLRHHAISARLTATSTRNTLGGFKRGFLMLLSLIYFILVGLVAGWAAGKIMKGGGYGAAMDIVLGIIGAVVGGWIFSALGIYPGGGIIASIVVATIGAIIVIWISRMIKRA